MDFLIIIAEGLRMYRRTQRVKKEGFAKYKGDAKEICRQIVEKCWNKEKQYFMVTPTGNYPEFYARDFAWVVESLLRLGYREKVRKTLTYALACYASAGKITTTISPESRPFDFPKYAPDSLASILFALALLKDKALVQRYSRFLNKEIYRFARLVVEPDTGLVKDKHFSSMKDYSIRKRSCYDTVMCAMVKRYAGKLGLANPLEKYDYKTILLENYWTGSYFLDDLSGKKYVAGDAQIWPFIGHIFDDKKMLKKVINTLRKHHLDTPVPLKYTAEHNSEVDMISIEIFAKDWEKHVCWTHMGPLYIKLVKGVYPNFAKDYVNIYTKLIEKYKNYLEVFDKKKKPYGSYFYYASDSMIWAANYLMLT